MDVSSLLAMIPEALLDKLTVETRVDHQVKKLKGSVVFKLILFSMLDSQKLSLRIMENYLESAAFRHFSGSPNLTSRHSSLRDRISTIDPHYFQKLFGYVFEKYNSLLGEKDALAKADSTYVSLSAKLLTWGMSSDGANRKVKYSIALKGSLPCHVQVWHEQKHISEDLALTDTVLNTEAINGGIVTFDRGIQSRKAFESFSSRDILFVGRARSSDRGFKQSGNSPVPPRPPDVNITVHADKQGYLRNRKNKWTELPFRLIEATIDKTGEPICFVTNIMDMPAYEVANIYRQRWEIEVFFKFVKQHLNMQHLISRNENGVKVMLYMTLITAILILAYRKLNNIESYKVAKHRFEIEMDNLMMREVVILCGGDPNKAKHLWNSS